MLFSINILHLLGRYVAHEHTKAHRLPALLSEAKNGDIPKALMINLVFAFFLAGDLWCTPGEPSHILQARADRQLWPSAKDPIADMENPAVL